MIDHEMKLGKSSTVSNGRERSGEHVCELGVKRAMDGLVHGLREQMLKFDGDFLQLFRRWSR